MIAYFICTHIINMPKKSAPERQKYLLRYLATQNHGKKLSEIYQAIAHYYPQEQAGNGQRMLQRDLEKLRNDNFIELTDNRCWQVGKLPFDDMDNSTAIALKILKFFDDIPLDEASNKDLGLLFGSAERKLKKYKHLQRIDEKIAFKPWLAKRQKPSIHSHIYDDVLNATLREQKISFGYINGQNQTSIKKGISPLGIFFYRDMIYLLGYHTEQQPNLRHYALQRFSNDSIEVIKNSKVEFPDNWQGLQHYLVHSSLFKDTPTQKQMVKIRFTNQYAVKNLQDAPLLEGNPTWQQCDDGSAILTAEFLLTQELVTWLLYYGCHAEVLEPASLRQKMIDEVRKMMGVYGV